MIVLVFVVSCRPPQQETDYSKMESSSSLDSILDSDDAEDLVTVAKLNCQQAASAGRLSTRVERINFLSTRNCEFNESADENEWWEINSANNGPKKNNRVRAALRQDVNLQLPADSTLCDIEFDFPTQSMKYDDEIFLLLNNYILLMSTDYSELSEDEDYQNEGLRVNSQGLVEFNWLNKPDSDYDLYNLKYGHNEAPRFCQGVIIDDSNGPNTDNRCKIPPTETTGDMKLDVPKDDIIKMGALNLGKDNSDGDLSFSFVTIGDDNSGDCEHSDYYFNVTLIYSEN